jgi:hypothetical protein
VDTVDDRVLYSVGGVHWLYYREDVEMSKREFWLTVFAGLAIGCSGVALAATRVFAYPHSGMGTDIFWWLWRLVGTVVGVVA